MPKRGDYGQTIRASHLGYDLYVTGQHNSTSGRVRIIQRPTRLPPNVSSDLRTMLPTEMWWPQRDIQQAMACIDACLVLDGAQMKRWKSQFPEHSFGYERFIDWIDRLRAAQHTNTPSAGGPGGPGKLTPVQLSHFPAQVESITPYHMMPEAAYVVKIALVKFQDHTSALRFTLYGRLVPGTESTSKHDLAKLSRAYVDPVSGEFDILEHYPGNYRALELPESLLQEVLGVRRFRMHRREGTMKRRADMEPDLEGAGEGKKGETRHGSPAFTAQMAHANATMGDSVRVQQQAFGEQAVRAPRPKMKRKTLVVGSGPVPERAPVLDAIPPKPDFEPGVVP